MPARLPTPIQLLRDETRAIVAQAWPVLVAQLASMGMMVIDTLLLGHYGAVDLAAVAVGGGIYISVVFALIGILQALGPIAAHHLGAGQPQLAAAALRQGFWLAALLSLPGMLLLVFPEPLLALSTLAPEVESKTRELLRVLAGGVPVVLAYRTFYSFCNAIGRTRPLMLFSLVATALHGPLAWALVYGHWGGAPLGAIGCGLSTVAVSGVSLLLALVYLLRGRGVRDYRVLHDWQRPDPAVLREFFRIGLPMGFSNFVEITSFTFIALFVAAFGAEIVAGHRIVANLAALAYMLPLSLGIAALARVGRHAGARDWAAAKAATQAGMGLAALLSTLTGLGVWFAAAALVGAFSDATAVRAVALSLIIYLAVYQFFDAVQTIAGYALRGLKATLAPMLVHVGCFWGIGLGGGCWLAWYGWPWAPAAQGVTGFWVAAAWSLVLAAVLLVAMLRRALRLRSAA